MDGKQARRTKSSSAVGLLIDHGVDALNINLNAMNVMAMLQSGTSPAQCLLIWLISATPFFFVTWEEYHTGVLHLGFFNGPTDGVLIMCASFVWSGIVEDYSALWNRRFAFGLDQRNVTIAFYAFCVFGTVAANFYGVARCGSSAKELLRAVQKTIPFCAIGVAAVVFLLTSQTTVAHEQPRLFLWLCGFTFQKLVTRLQLVHLTGEDYQPWKEPLLVLLGLWLVLTNVATGYFDEVAILYCFVAIAASSWLSMVWQVALEVAGALGIDIFRIPWHVNAL